MTAPASFFEPDGDSFVATELTRGPWSRDHQHGGPPGALLARAIEHALEANGRETTRESRPAGFQVVRFTAEIVRPLPLARVSVATEVVRAGKSVREVRAVLSSAGRELVRATAIAIRTTALELPRSFERPLAFEPPERCPLFEFPFFSSDLGYQMAMECRVARGRFGEGSFGLWMRMRYPLLPAETPTALQRVVTAADSGGGISLALDTKVFTFVNPDLTISLHRLAEGEWIALDAVTTAWPSGIGLAEAQLSDARGPIGRSLQSLVVERRTTTRET